MMDVELRDWVNDQILTYLPLDRIRQGDKLLFRCPICGDSKKNASKKRGYYYLKTASYHCFNCDANLTGMKLLEFLSGEEYGDLKKKYFRTLFDGKHFSSLSSQGNFAVDNSKNDNSLLFKNVLKPEWKKPLTDIAERYLKQRYVLDAPFLKEPLYSYVSKKGAEYILIPWRINGVDAYFQLNDFQGLSNTGMKYIFPKDKEKLIYGLDNIDLSFPYLICFEGVYDSLFVPNGLAIGGKYLTDLQSKILRKRFPSHKVVYALDNDKPGLLSMARALDKNSSTQISFFKWFDSSTKPKDINDLVKATGNVNIFRDKEYVKSMIVDSISMKLWLVKQGLVDNGKNNKQGKTGKVFKRPFGGVSPITPGKVQGKIPSTIQVCPGT